MSGRTSLQKENACDGMVACVGTRAMLSRQTKERGGKAGKEGAKEGREGSSSDEGSKTTGGRRGNEDRVCV